MFFFNVDAARNIEQRPSLQMIGAESNFNLADDQITSFFTKNLSYNKGDETESGDER